MTGTGTFHELSDGEKRHALSKLLLSRMTGPGRPHPLSYSQESRWALARSTPGAGVENHSFAWRIRAAVDPYALRRAIHALLQRYTCLRSVFGDYQGRTVRYVQQAFDVPFQEHDCTAWTEADTSAAIAREVLAPFDLEAGPVMRVRLFRRREDECTLLVTAHHIVVDFWSLGIVLRRLGEAYLAVLGGAPVEAASDEEAYGRFVVWEAGQVLGPPGEAALRFWGRQLAGGLDFVALPNDRPWPRARGFRDAEHRFSLGDAVARPLKALAQEQQCTLFAVMLALFKLAIYSYTGQGTLAVISPVSSRSRLGFEELVGALSNHLLLCTRIDEGGELADLFRQIHRTVAGSMEHRDFPISLVTRRVQVRGMPEGAVPFPIKFNMPRAHLLKGDLGEPGEREPRLTVALDAFSASLELVDRRVTGNSELNLGVFETQGGLLGSLQYNVELFDPGTISDLVARFSRLAELVADRGSAPVRELVAACRAVTT